MTRLTNGRKVKCTHCGYVMQTSAKTHTSCKSCHKAFNVNSKKAQVSEGSASASSVPSKPASSPLKSAVKMAPSPLERSEPTQVKVTHVPEPRKEPGFPEGESLGEPREPEREGAEEAQAQMIQPEGLYTIFIELPNNLYVLIQPELTDYLTITPAEENQMRSTCTMLYDYCVRHGIVIPDYLELLAIILQFAGFHIKRIQRVKKKFDADAEARRIKPPEHPEGAAESTAADRNVNEIGVDMDELNRKMAHTHD